MTTFFSSWSKKLTATLVAIAIILLNKKFELGLVDSEIWALVGVAGAYAIGQGLADVGKSRAVIDQQTIVLKGHPPGKVANVTNPPNVQ